MTNSQCCCQESKYKERLCASLVLDIIGDRVWDEILELEEDLRAKQQLVSDLYLYYKELTFAV